jgi:PAS domain S-box-containing protein
MMPFTGSRFKIFRLEFLAAVPQVTESVNGIGLTRSGFTKPNPMAKRVPQYSEGQFQFALDAQPTAMLMVNHRGDVIMANSAAEGLFGRKRRHLLGRPIRQLVQTTALRARRSSGRSIAAWQAVRTGKIRRELFVHRDDRAALTVQLEVRSLDTPQGRHKLYSLVDISERKQAGAALRESEARFRVMANTAPVMIWVSNSTKLCTFFNKVWLNFTGRSLEQELGSGWTEGIHPEDLSRCVDIYATSFDARESFRMEFRLQRADGEYRWIQDNGVPLFAPDGTFGGYIGSCIDITDSKQARQEACSRQKLESLGVATARIAHDFGNLFSGMIGHAELMLDDLTPGSLNARNAAAIFELASRGSEIVKELIIYTGQDDSQSELLELPKVIQQMQELLKISIPKQANLKVSFGQDRSTVFASAAHIRQVVMNLAMNATEAIGDQPGTIEIAVSEAEVKCGDSRESTGLPPGRYASLSVSDTGAGLTPELQARIFDPFFTTKPDGRGIGLAVTKGIVERYGGRVIVQSTPGRGSRFEIFLPLAGQTNRRKHTAKSGK